MRSSGGQRFLRGATAAVLFCASTGALAVGTEVAPVRALGPITSTQISTDDIVVDPTSQHQTEVEPTTAAWGNTIVSTFQVGRFATLGSGASATGWATSIDGGATWTDGVLTGISTTTNPAGPYPRSVNMTVAYDSVHAQWLIVTVGLQLVNTSYAEIEMLVSRSSDGLNWSAPISVVNTLGPDKSWIVCDNGATSPHHGRCYVVYSSDDLGLRFQSVYTDDGGLTWSAPVATAGNAAGYDANPVIRPNGDVVVLATQNSAAKIVSFVSTDGGATYSAPVTVATVQKHTVAGGIRARVKPSATVDESGRVYAGWFDCRFRTACASNDIVYAISDTTGVWSAPLRIDVDATTSTIDHFVVGLGVQPDTSGATAHLSAIFYQLPNANCASSTCLIDAVTTSSYNGGATWEPVTKLNTAQMKPWWLANSNLGRMLADYHNVAYVNGVPFAGMSIAAKPASATAFRQAIYGIRLGDAAINQPPVAAFTSSCALLTCTFDATASTDPDGTITNYVWDFGDATNGTGIAPGHAYAADGTYTVTLTVTDNDGATASQQQQVSVSSATNQSPIAQFTPTCNWLVCDFNAAASSDPDGSIAAYAWDFGDGTNGSGVTAQRTYAAGGTYQVTLTVTDNGGAQSTQTQPVMVIAPFALDAFSRTVTNGWGTADLGGTWTISGTAANFGVNNGSAFNKLTAVNTAGNARLNAVSSQSFDITTRVSIDQAPVGSGVWLNVAGRSVNSGNEYRARVRFASNGVHLALTKITTGSSASFLVADTTTGLTATPGQWYRVRVNAFGSNPTTIRAKVWLDGQPEPNTWLVTTTDSTAALQASGNPAVSTWMQGTTPLPLNFRFDDLTITA